MTPRHSGSGKVAIPSADVIQYGDLPHLPALLASRVALLQALVATLLRKSEDAGNYLEAAEAYMRLALRAEARLLAAIQVLAAEIRA